MGTRVVKDMTLKKGHEFFVKTYLMEIYKKFKVLSGIEVK